MKKLFRKIISVGLALMMTLTYLQIGELKVKAVSCAVNDAVSWITNKAETGWNTDVDGEWGCQCVDLIYAYYLFLGYPSQGGNAFQYAQGSFGIPAGSGWYKDTTPSPGAIIVWSGYTDTGSWTTGENGHVGLVYSVSGSTVYTVESNVDNGGSIYGGPARYRTRYPKNAVYIHPVFSDSPGVPPIDYSPITPGNYFIISQSDGKSLTLANNEDWNTNNIHMYETMWNNRGQHMEISQAPDGYKIRPIDSTRLVNPYGDYAAEGQNINIYADVNDSSQWWKFEKVGEGYVIHNAQNPNLVIDNADSSEAKLWTFNNGSNQKWLLIPAAAPDAPVIKGVKSSYEQSETIIVDWDATYNTDRYDIGVAKYENGDYKWMFWQGNVTPQFNVSAAAELGAGDYRMRLESVNIKISLGGGNVYLSTVGEYVYFSIKENAAAPTIRINNTSTAVGKQVKIPVYIDNAKISSLAFTVKFDPQVLKYVSVNEMVFGNYDVNTGSASTGSVRLACFNEGSAVSGKIVVLNFEVIAKKACNTRVGIHNSEAYDNQDKAVTLKETEADISIGASSILGDVNNDGKTNIIDARWLLQAASGSRKLTEAQKAVADVNKDGKINVIDARWMLQVASGSRKL